MQCTALVSNKLNLHFTLHTCKPAIARRGVTVGSLSNDNDNDNDDDDGNENVIKAIGTLRLRSQGTSRTFARLKNLTGHSVHTEPFHIFALLHGTLNGYASKFSYG